MAHGGHGFADRPAVSVIVPSYRGAALIGRCLESLATQTLEAAAFEVLVVINGPADATPAVVEAVRGRFPQLRLRTIRSSVAGASRARNLGLASAAGEFVTFVDHDDWVSSSYLAALLAAAEPGTVPVAQVADVAVAADGTLGVPEFNTYIGNYLLPLAGVTAGPGGRSTALGFVAAKLLPVAVARLATLDEDLRSGEDVVYWHDVYAAAPFALRVCRIEEHAVYYRALTAGSVSRQERSFDFSVEQRLDVIERLVARVDPSEEAARLTRGMVSAQVAHMAGYLAAHPDEASRVRDVVILRGVEDVIPFRVLNSGAARDLAILYAFAPFADTSAIVAARRIRARGVVVDVVSNNLRGFREQDASTAVISDAYVGRRHQVRSKATAFEWPALEKFCRDGMEVVEEWVDDKGPYRSVYSRAMQPGSHLLAALVKLRWPETRWIAEFSDPVLWNAYGQRRVGPVREGDLLETLSAAISAAGIDVPKNVVAPHLVELVAYALADEIQFTNQNQMDFMLGYLDEPELVEHVRAIATVAHHPTLPSAFYQRVHTSVERVPGRINIAYFGAFYLTRGLTEVIDALQSLTAKERASVVLRVFTSDPDALNEEVARKGLSDVVHPSNYVPYLEFLNLTTTMDVLLVNDARTRGLYDLNPFLPSKWSDYSGSGRDIWAIVEPGSVLSGMSTAYRSELGDVATAAAQIRQMIADHRPNVVS